MPLLRSIIYTGSLGGTRGRLANVIVEGVAWCCCSNNGLQVLWTSTRMPSSDAMALSASLTGVFSLLSIEAAREIAKKQECREFPETFASFSTWRLGRW